MRYSEKVFNGVSTQLLPKTINPKSCKKRCYFGFILKWCQDQEDLVAELTDSKYNTISFNITAGKNQGMHVDIQFQERDKYEGAVQKWKKTAWRLEAFNNSVLED